MSLVEVRNLCVRISHTATDIVEDVSFDMNACEVVGLVGESGSGKTTIALCLLGDTRKGAQIRSGSISIDGSDILRLSKAGIRALRGTLVSYVPQDPSSALNPAVRVGRQLSEMFDVHVADWSDERRHERTQALLSEVRLPDTSEFLRRFPHQLSGGQQQRLAIAMAFALNPRLVILDEPTTGLDVTTQAHILKTVRRMCQSHQVAALYVSHDLAVVADISDRLMVAYAGRLVEVGAGADVFSKPSHPYTRRLLATIPHISGSVALQPIPGRAPSPENRPAGCSFALRCADRVASCDKQPPIIDVGIDHHAACFRATEVHSRGPIQAVARADATVGDVGEGQVLSIRDVHVAYGSARILHGVSLDVRPRQCVALVGESGSGKTTLSRAVVGLARWQSGSIRFGEHDLSTEIRGRDIDVRREIQYIFQSPYNSLNPRRRIGAIIGNPLRHFFGLKGSKATERIGAALDAVSMPESSVSKYPGQLSGGERQRVAIARALACEPRLLVCDEITSALDVSVQAAIVGLLKKLQVERGLGLLFVTHNLALVRSIADHVVVLEQGRVVESGPTRSVFSSPSDEYTRQLLADTAGLASAI